MSDALPRWTFALRHSPNGPEFQILTDAPDLVAAEVTQSLLQAAMMLNRNPVARILTQGEVKQQEHRAGVLKEFPAQVFYTRGKNTLWFNKKSLRAPAGTGTLVHLLAEHGWVRGHIPEGTQQPCDYALDAEAALTQLVAAREEEEPGEDDAADADNAARGE